MTNIEMIKCSKCTGDMPELRLTKFGYSFCVNCSTEKPEVAISVTGGSGDHTYNTIQILTSDQYTKYKKQEELSEKIKFEDV